MKATLSTKNLREALQKVNLLPVDKLLPVLENTMIDFANGKAMLTTTDLERTIRVITDSTNTEHFSILLPRKTAEKFLHGANGKISIELAITLNWPPYQGMDWVTLNSI